MKKQGLDVPASVRDRLIDLTCPPQAQLLTELAGLAMALGEGCMPGAGED